MKATGWAITAGLGAAAGAVGIMMMSRQNPVRRLAAIGYQYGGDLGIPHRHAFAYRDKPHLQTHHLYLCPRFSPELHRHITFRDYLRTHPEAVKEYSTVKEEAARLFPDDIDRYIQYKSPCIQKIYTLCGLNGPAETKGGPTMKKIIAVNGSPRTAWNTAQLIRKAAEGAQSAGAEIVVYDLYQLEPFTGCVSCFGCKLQPNLGKCVCRDGLSQLLEDNVLAALSRVLAQNHDLPRSEQDIRFYLQRLRDSVPTKERVGSMNAGELDDFLAKPINSFRLLSSLAKFL